MSAPRLMLPPAGWHWDATRATALAQNATDRELLRMWDAHAAAYHGYLRVHNPRPGAWSDVLDRLNFESAARWRYQTRGREVAASRRRMLRSLMKARAA